MSFVKDARVWSLGSFTCYSFHSLLKIVESTVLPPSDICLEGLIKSKFCCVASLRKFSSCDGVRALNFIRLHLLMCILYNYRPIIELGNHLLYICMQL